MYADEIIFLKSNGFLPNPKVFQIEITNECPLNCPQCYKDVEKPEHIDFEVLKKSINEANTLGVKRIMINGGEPLLYNKLLSAIELMNANNILPTCYTSGIGMDQTIARYLKKTNIELMLSFNGSNDEINSLSRDGFGITLKAAEILKSNDVEFGINWVARHDNAKDLPEMIRLARKLGANGITVVCNKISGEYEANEPLDLEDFEYITKLIRSPENEKYLTIQNCNNILAVYSYNMPMSRLYGCPAGITSCCITVNGLYAPCPHLYYTEEFGSIKEYWQKSIYLNELRNNPTEKLEFCDTCKRNSKCRFCRAISKISHSNFGKGYKDCPLYIS